MALTEIAGVQIRVPGGQYLSFFSAVGVNEGNCIFRVIVPENYSHGGEGMVARSLD